jgi:addiction module HigA family antidote
MARWRCRNQQCDRRIFTERLPGLAAPFARHTARLAEIVRLLGHSAGGRLSERLMRRLGMPVSGTTILRSLKEHADLSPDMALRIEKAFGVSMETLMRMQNGYDIAQARRREGEMTVKRYVPKPEKKPDQPKLF